MTSEILNYPGYERRAPKANVVPKLKPPLGSQPWSRWILLASPHATGSQVRTKNNTPGLVWASGFLESLRHPLRSPSPYVSGRRLPRHSRSWWDI